MRTEKEIMTMILNVATGDERIRAVLLNGSKANPSARKDKFQDFDVVFMVTEMDTFLADHSWIDIFGERIILQMPDQMKIAGSEISGQSFGYLMLFRDKNRIDLTLYPVEKLEKDFNADSHTLVLLDKDKLFADVPAFNDSGYLVQKPTDKLFYDCCNEFWWVSTYVAKGLWRNEISYAKDMFEKPVRDMFLKIIEWHIGIETGFAASFGKSGKNMQTYLHPALYQEILSTYPNAETGQIWKSLFVMTGIFSELAKKISVELGFDYNVDEEQNVMEYLKWVNTLPEINTIGNA